MLFMVIERFRNGDPLPVYRRLRDQGRMVPASLKVQGSWITDDLSNCYQVMETDNRALLDEWMSHWNDIVDFEVIPVITSAQAQTRVAPRL